MRKILILSLLAVIGSRLVAQEAKHTSVAPPVSEVTVVLTDLSDKVHPTYLFVPSARVTNAESIDASTVSLMIVVDFGSQVPDHKLIAEHFAKDPQRGDFHIRMDLPEGIIGIDLRDPGRFTAEELRANGNHKNMELMAASLYKERGKAIYDRYYRELTALRASKIVRGRIIGQVDGNGAFRSSESRN